MFESHHWQLCERLDDREVQGAVSASLAIRFIGAPEVEQ